MPGPSPTNWIKIFVGGTQALLCVKCNPGDVWVQPGLGIIVLKYQRTTLNFQFAFPLEAAERTASLKAELYTWGGEHQREMGTWRFPIRTSFQVSQNRDRSRWSYVTEMNHIKTLDLAYVWLWEIVDSTLCSYSWTLPMLYLVVMLVAYRKKLVYHTHLDFLPWTFWQTLLPKLWYLFCYLARECQSTGSRFQGKLMTSDSVTSQPCKDLSETSRKNGGRHCYEEIAGLGVSELPL